MILSMSYKAFHNLNSSASLSFSLSHIVGFELQPIPSLVYTVVVISNDETGGNSSNQASSSVNFFLWDWRLNSGLCTYKAGALLTA
jgi:hypothetical protein